MQLLKSFFKGKSRGIVALSFTPDGIAIAVSNYRADNSRSLIFCDFIHTTMKFDTLKELTATHRLTDYDCYIVLATEDYRLISLESPLLDDNDEMLAAIRWKVADLVDFPSDDALIDFYPLPISNRANSVAMVEVAVSPKSSTQGLIDLCHRCNLTISSITIQETSLRNLASLLTDSERGVVLLRLQKNSGHILITYNDIMHLNRKIASSFDRLNDDGSVSLEQIKIEQNGLALEIQRSKDHVLSAYGFSSNTELTILPTPNNTQGILNFLINEHGITARIMDLATLIDGSVMLNDNIQAMCAPVIGATLQYDSETAES